jgi:tryptophan synthase beta chain
MGKTRLIAETAPVSTAWPPLLRSFDGYGMRRFMGEEDTKRQALNVYRMRLLAQR